MATRPQPDPKTLEEVHELLQTTQFASIEDLVGRSDVGVAPDPGGPARQAEVLAGDGGELSPLPRRR